MSEIVQHSDWLQQVGMDRTGYSYAKWQHRNVCRISRLESTGCVCVLETGTVHDDLHGITLFYPEGLHNWIKDKLKFYLHFFHYAGCWMMYRWMIILLGLTVGLFSWIVV